MVDKVAIEKPSEMFVFVVCVFCITICFSDVNALLELVSVIVDVGEVCFGILRGVSDIVGISSDIGDVRDVVDVGGYSCDQFRHCCCRICWFWYLECNFCLGWGYIHCLYCYHTCHQVC